MEIKLVNDYVDTLTIEVNEDFEYILNKLKGNFTKFELANFVTLQSKYAKNLFRLLVQYRNMANIYEMVENKKKFKWNDFKKLMGIPESFSSDANKIEKQIIEPAINEISFKQMRLFTNYNDVDFPFFKNLRYERIKLNPEKKGSKTIEIEFTWDRLDKKVLDKTIEAKKTRLEAGIKAAFALGEKFVALFFKENKDDLIEVGLLDPNGELPYQAALAELSGSADKASSTNEIEDIPVEISNIEVNSENSAVNE